MSFTYLIRTDPYSIALRKNATNESIQFRGEDLSLVLSCNFNELEDKNSFVEKNVFYGCMGIFRASNNEPYLILVTNVKKIVTRRESGTLKKKHFISADCAAMKHFHIYFITECTLISLRSFEEKHDDAKNFENLFSNDNSSYFFATNCDTQFPRDLSGSYRFKAESDQRFLWNWLLRQPLCNYGADVEKWLIFLLRGYAQVKWRENLRSKHSKYAAFILKVAFPISERSDCSFDDRNYIDTFEVEHMVWKGKKLASFVSSSGAFQIDWESCGNKTVRFPKGFASPLLNHYRYMKILRQLYENISVLNLFSSNFTNAYDLYESCAGQPDGLPKSTIPWGGTNNIQYDYFFKTPTIDNNLLSNVLLKKLFGQDLDVSIYDEKDIVKRQKTLIHITLIGELELLTKCHQTLSRDIAPRLISDGLNMKNCGWLVDFFEDSWLDAKENIEMINSEWRSFVSDRFDSEVPNSLRMFLPKLYFSSDSRLSGDFCLSNCLLPEIVLKEINEEFKKFTDENHCIVSNVAIRISDSKMFRESLDHENWLIDLIDNCETENNSLGLPNPFQYEETANVIATSDVLAIGIIFPDYVTEDDPYDSIPEKILTILCGSDRMNNYSLLYKAEYLTVNFLIFVKNEILPNTSQPTSIAGAIKDSEQNMFQAVAIRFSIFSNSISLVCSHFPQIEQKQGLCINRTNFSAQLMSLLQFESFDKKLSLNNHDYVFWFGSLFYPICDNPNNTSLINNGSWCELSKSDELCKQMINPVRQGLADFNEIPIIFSIDYQSKCFSERSLYKVNGNSTQVRLDVRPKGYDADHSHANSIMRASYQILTSKVDPEKRKCLIMEKLEKVNGPSDATIEVTLPIALCSHEARAILLAKLESAVEANNHSIIAKHKNKLKVWFRFSNSKSAQEVQLRFHRQEIDEHLIDVNIHSPRLSDLFQAHTESTALVDFLQNEHLKDTFRKLLFFIGRSYNEPQIAPTISINSQGITAPLPPMRKRAGSVPIIATAIGLVPNRRITPHVLDSHPGGCTLRKDTKMQLPAPLEGNELLIPKYPNPMTSTANKGSNQSGASIDCSDGSLTPNYLTMANSEQTSDLTSMNIEDTNIVNNDLPPPSLMLDLRSITELNNNEESENEAEVYQDITKYQDM